MKWMAVASGLACTSYVSTEMSAHLKKSVYHSLFDEYTTLALSPNAPTLIWVAISPIARQWWTLSYVIDSIDDLCAFL